MSKAMRNDALRASIRAIAKPDVLILTKGIYSFSDDDVAHIMEKVKNFKDFNPNNDPHGEHDFGSFEYKGKRIFWKIDDYNGHGGYQLVLTVMLADEY